MQPNTHASCSCCRPRFLSTPTQLLHEVVSKSVFGRNADTGEKKKTIQVQRGQLTDGSPVIGMTMHKSDFE